MDESDDKGNDSEVHKHFYQRLTMFDSHIKYEVMPYGDEDNIEVFQPLFNIWTFSNHLNNFERQIDIHNEVNNEETTITREDEIGLIREALERNGF